MSACSSHERRTSFVVRTRLRRRHEKMVLSVPTNLRDCYAVNSLSRHDTGWFGYGRVVLYTCGDWVLYHFFFVFQLEVLIHYVCTYVGLRFLL